MKKNFWVAALASVVLVGCVNEVPVVEDNDKQPQELKFGDPMMSKQSRAVGEILGAKYPGDESFVVYSVVHDGPFAGWEESLSWKQQHDNDVTNDKIGDAPFFPLDGVVVSKSAVNNYWHITGATKYYWPKDEAGTDYKMTFAAYSPASLGHPSDPTQKYAEGINYGKFGLTVTGYTMPDDPAKHFDLMYSTRTTDAETSPIAINFKHALASIRFMFVKQAFSTGGAYSINVRKVSIIGHVANKGNFSQYISSVANSSGDPQWENLETVMDDKGTPSNPADDVTKEYVLYNDEFTVPEGSSAEIDGISSFMAIPQTVNENMKVRIVYDVVMNEGSTPVLGIVRELPFTGFTLPSSTAHIARWNRANRYVYTIQFGALREIFFTPTISEDWVTEGNASFFSIGNVGG